MWDPTSYGGNDNHTIGVIIQTIDNNDVLSFRYQNDEDRKENEDTVTALRWERQMYGSQPRYSDDCLPEFFLDGQRITYGRTECDMNTSGKQKKIQHSKDRVENRVNGYPGFRVSTPFMLETTSDGGVTTIQWKSSFILLTTMRSPVSMARMTRTENKMKTL